MGIDGVGSFPTAGVCDDSEESDWPTATTRSKQFWYMNEESMGMARSKSRGTDSFWHWTVGDRLCRSPNNTTISQVMLSIGPNQ